MRVARVIAELWLFTATSTATILWWAITDRRKP